MRLDLRKRIMLPVAAIVVVALGVIALATYLLTKGALEEATVQGLANLASSKAELIDLWLEDAKSVLKVSATRDELVAVLKQDNESNRQVANRELKEQVANLSGFSHLSVANAQGEVRASSKPESVGVIKVPDRDYFLGAMKGQATISHVNLSRSTNQPAMSVSAPLKDGDKVVGVIYGVLDLGKFNDVFVDPVKVARTGYIAIFDPQGVAIAHKDKSAILKLKLSDQEWGRLWLQTKEGEVAYREGGERRLAVLKPSKAAGWTVAVSAPAAEVFTEADRITILNLALALAGLVGILVVLYFIARSVVGPINRISDGLGDGAHQVSEAAAQVADASQALARGSAEQAASLEETSASLEEMSSMTTTSADNAQQANAMMDEAKAILERANQAMADLTKSMAEVKSASEQTGKIVKTIDEISFQTNLLALNAAVEAARAGEAGAGFAVVADEVRNLAMRAAEAARNTAELIETTVTRVKAGSELVERTSQAFAEVSDNSRKVAGLVGEIAAASAEQAQGIKHVNQAATQMSQVTQQNAAGAEESAAASEELSAQAKQMQEYVYELMRLVGGSGNGAFRPARAVASAPLARLAPAALPAPSSQPARSTQAPPAASAQKGKPTPAEAFPLDDDFKDF